MSLAIVPFSPSNTDNSERYTAVDATKFKYAKATPRELILHESINGLVSEVAELRARCEGLENLNEELFARVNTLEKAQRDSMIPMRAPLTKENLTGYSSDGSDIVDALEEQGHRDYEQRFDTVRLVLEQFDRKLQARDEKESKFEAKIAELTEYKRETQRLFGALKTELNGLDVSALPEQGAATDQQQYNDVMALFNHNQEVILQGQMENGEKLKHILDGLESVAAQAVHSAPTSGEGGNGESDGPDGNNVLLKRVQQNVNEASRGCVSAKFRQEEKIDDAATKDLLYRQFADIDSIMVTEDEKSRSCGDFHGTFNELWLLRSRVVDRIAIFDASGKAFQEARQAVKELAGDFR
ncbi:hypothetical protein LTR56_024157 [Elasticomyces elasticus]|nr:hypothetical protein LTR56_024157 [Elasticomyces elasticus]KAK3622275.1 hypothetical protein LTR22_024861 [Elasticomyces elasticus]KAK4906445.1 hypothetical protein LTR49_024414 [Elasticomyces elasticus]KAK5754866.1 hypothetical protein LTS12_015082 [Elasticomyces elasticus]